MEIQSGVRYWEQIKAMGVEVEGDEITYSPPQSQRFTAESREVWLRFHEWECKHFPEVLWKTPEALRNNTR